MLLIQSHWEYICSLSVKLTIEMPFVNIIVTIFHFDDNASVSHNVNNNC